MKYPGLNTRESIELRSATKPRHIVMEEDLVEIREMIEQAQRELKSLKDSFEGGQERRSVLGVRILVAFSLLAGWGSCMYLVWWMAQ